MKIETPQEFIVYEYPRWTEFVTNPFLIRKILQYTNWKIERKQTRYGFRMAVGRQHENNQHE